eukprot:9158836-Heterocapsa_arctica.AAC.1
MGGAHEEQNDHEVKDTQIVEHQNKELYSVQCTKKRNAEHSENELYPGVSSQKRMEIRAEQPNKTVYKEAATQRKIQKLLGKDNGNLDQGANKRIKIDKVCLIGLRNNN